MVRFWQHLPELVDPIAFTVGGFIVYWYSLMWLASFAVCYGALRYRIYRKEGVYSVTLVQDAVVNALLGALLGGRLGYVVFYDLPYYLQNPLAVISPYDFSVGEWVGIYGMSYHGGVIGVIVAILWTIRKAKVQALRFFDFIVPAIPLGYVFGRLGNFFNQELVGRVTTSQWGMYFNQEAALRYPSQLMEAFFEGIVLFVLLWSVRNKEWKPGMLSALYIIEYAIMRFFVEFFRNPDEHLGFITGFLTMGQILSIVMFVIGMAFIIWVNWRNNFKNTH